MGYVSKSVKKGALARPLSPADEIDAAALSASVSKMIGILEVWDYSRPLSSLNKDDLKKLAVAAISGFILEQVIQHKRTDIQWDELNIAAASVG